MFSAMRKILGLGITSLLTFTGCQTVQLKSSPGRPHGASFRLPDCIATLVVTEEPHAPKLQPNQPDPPMKIALLLTPLDAAPPRLLPIAGNLNYSSFAHSARFHGLDQNLLRFQAHESLAYDTQSQRLLRAGEIPPGAGHSPSLSAQAAEQDPRRHFTSGLALSPTSWLGLHTAADVERGDFRPGARFSPRAGFTVETYPSRGMQKRKLYQARLGTTFESITALGDEEFDNGVFLRSASPGAAFLLYESGVFPKKSIFVARLDASGKILWRADTTIGKLEQVLPDPSASPNGVLALRGDPVAVPGKFGQPLLALVSLDSGQTNVSQLRY